MVSDIRLKNIQLIHPSPGVLTVPSTMPNIKASTWGMATLRQEPVPPTKRNKNKEQLHCGVYISMYIYVYFINKNK